MGRNFIETVMGAVVLLIAGIFLVFAYNFSGLQTVEGYSFVAKFNSVGGLRSGSDVRIGGVKVGSVTDQRLDTEDYRAVLTVTVSREVRLPVDTKAMIASDGLFGGNYLRLVLGTKKEFLKPGGEIKHTRDVVALEELLGKAIFMLTEEGGSEDGK